VEFGKESTVLVFSVIRHSLIIRMGTGFGDRMRRGKKMREEIIQLQVRCSMSRVTLSLLKMTPIKLRRFVDSKGRESLVIDSQLDSDILYHSGHQNFSHPFWGEAFQDN